MERDRFLQSDPFLVIEYINSNPLIQLKGENMIILSLEASPL